MFMGLKVARQSRDDTGQQNEYGVRPCPRCGRMVSTCAYGYHSHLRACLKRTIVFDGKTYLPAEK